MKINLVKKIVSLPKNVIFECYILIIGDNNNFARFWFKANDVAKFLEYKNPKNAIYDNVHCEFRKSWAEEAIPFQQVLYEEVLPSICRHKFILYTQFRTQNAIYKNDQNSGVVYVVATPKMAEEDVYKIGCTGDIKKRLYSLNSANYFEHYKLFYLYYTSDKYKYERLTHLILRKYRVRNEFFKIPKNNLHTVINSAFSKLQRIQS